MVSGVDCGLGRVFSEPKPANDGIQYDRSLSFPSPFDSLARRSTVRRRNLLQGVCAAGVTSIGGCLGMIPTVGETTLGLFAVYNLDQGSGHTFSVRIDRDGTIVHRSSHELGAYDPASDSPSPPHAIVDCTWENIPGEYTVFVSRDGRDSKRYRIVDDALRPPECVIVYARYRDLRDTGTDEPSLDFVLDETNCAEVRSLPGGCPDAIP